MQVLKPSERVPYLTVLHYFVFPGYCTFLSLDSLVFLFFFLHLSYLASLSLSLSLLFFPQLSSTYPCLDLTEKERKTREKPRAATGPTGQGGTSLRADCLSQTLLPTIHISSFGRVRPSWVSVVFFFPYFLSRFLSIQHSIPFCLSVCLSVSNTLVLFSLEIVFPTVPITLEIDYFISTARVCFSRVNTVSLPSAVFP